jgi:hypothetical protein
MRALLLDIGEEDLHLYGRDVRELNDELGWMLAIKKDVDRHELWGIF